jgi:hypothetical protein
MEQRTSFEAPPDVAPKHFNFATFSKDSFSSHCGYDYVLDSGDATYLVFLLFTPKLTLLLHNTAVHFCMVLIFLSTTISSSASAEVSHPVLILNGSWSLMIHSKTKLIRNGNG